MNLPVIRTQIKLRPNRQIDLKVFKVHAHLKPHYHISTKWPWLYWKSHSKQKLRALTYCRYKFYNNKFFQEKFFSKLNNNSLPKQGNSLERFQEAYLTVLNSIAPLSRKIKPSFLHRHIFNWHTFSRQVTVRWWRQWGKNQVLTNQNSRNRWCQIARQTIWIKAN